MIEVTTARYGRMALGSCVTYDVGMGCFNDILQPADRWCSGKQMCAITNAKLEMDAELGVSCPEELTSYIEITHQCLSGEYPL